MSQFLKIRKFLSVKRNGENGPGPKGTVMMGTFQIEGQQFYVLNGGPAFNSLLSRDFIFRPL